MTLLEALKEIKRRLDCGESLPNATWGICYNVSVLTSQFLSKDIYDLSSGWVNHSTDTEYPVETFDNYYSREGKINRWNRSTKYGNLRHELLDFLIAELEKGG